MKHAQYFLGRQASAVLVGLQAMEDHQALCQHALGSDYVTLATALEQLQANIRPDNNCGVRPDKAPARCLNLACLAGIVTWLSGLSISAKQC